MAVIASPQINLGGTFNDSFLKKAVAGIGQFAQNVKKTTKEINEHALKMTSGYEKVGQVYLKTSSDIVKNVKQVKQAKIESAKITKAALEDEKRLLGQIDNLWGIMAKSTRKAIKAQQDLQKSLKNISSQLWVMTMGVQQFGRSMSIAFTAPLVAAAGLSLKVFADWEKGMLKIQSAAEITRESAEKITDGFIKISQNVPITVEELQKAGFAAAQAGVTGEKAITNFAQAAVKLSKVGGDAFKDLPIEKLSNDLAKLSIAFGESGENMENVNNTASMLLSVSKAVPGGLAEVVEALRRTAGAAQQYGVSLADATAYMGTLVAAGVPAARAGTEFNSILRNLYKNWEAVGEVMGYSGEELDKFKDRVETDLSGVLLELIQRLKGVESSVDRATIISEIFGETATKALLPLINNTQLYADLQARANHELENGTLLAAEFDIQANSLSGTMKTFSNNLKALGGVVGKDLAPYVNLFLKTFTEGLRKLVIGWRSLNPSIKFAIFLVGALLAVIGPLALLLNTMFLNPIAGIVTFIVHQARLSVELGKNVALSQIGTVSFMGFASSLKSAAGATGALVKGLAILSLKFIAMLAVIALVAAALYGIGRLLGIRLKLPTMPSLKMPKLGKVGLPGAEEGKQPELATEADKKAAKKKEKDLAKELKAKKKAKKKELRSIQEGIDAYEKVKNKEIKARQKLVDAQKDALDLRKEQWEDEKRIEDEKIRAQQESLEYAKKTLKESKKALNELKKARDEDLNVAEGMVDYNKMQLEAAQDRLKRMKILGKDEFDAEYRAAEAKVEAFEDSTLLAKENVLKVKQEYQKQIAAQQDLIDINQEQIDVENYALDDLKDALAERKAIVDKEIDLLDDELKIRQSALDSIKESTQEKLDALKEEKDARQQAWDDEIEILQDRLDAAREQAQAIADMPKPVLPDLAGTMGALDEELNKQIEDMQKKIKESLSMGLEIDEKGPLANFLAMFTEGWEDLKRRAQKEGKSVIQVYLEGIGEGLKEGGKNLSRWLSELWDGIQKNWGELWENLLIILQPSIDNIRKSIESSWEGIKNFFKNGLNFIKNLWTSTWKSIKGLFQTIWGIISSLVTTGLSRLSNTWTNTWDKIRNKLQNVMSLIKNILRNAWSNITSIFNFSKIWNRLQNLSNNIRNWGRSFIDNLVGGIKDNIKKVFQEGGAVARALKKFLGFSKPPEKGPLHNTIKWGEGFVENFAKGINKSLPYLENVIRNVGSGIDTNFIGNAAGVRPAPATVPTSTGTVINKNYYIQPGQMIASRGEVRNFVRMLKEYDRFEEGR